MKKIFLIPILLFAATFVCAQESKDIKLKAPQKNKGAKIMQALSNRKSTRTFDAKELDIQTISNLLWAANGINRPDGKRTAPSAMNRQEVDVYVCLKSGAYFFNPQENELKFISDADCLLRDAPLTLYLVARAQEGNTWAYIDTGIVSQNISLFASGFGLATVPQGSMPKEKIIKDLKLTDNQLLILNHPVGYPAKENKEKNK
ncbi:SagB/ThcOx family dehydrogenase [Candidatus Proelusimicrobium volucris]|uniref:SagB/ThcOx family dehydrogenase n=1 Tax=Candidatus Proelusimicrobium volucris TaxID=3416225 RepID=UPI003D0FC77A